MLYRTYPRNELQDEHRKEIDEAWNLFDMNQDGKIDFHEFKVALRALGFDVQKSEIRRWLTEKGDGNYIVQAQFEEVASELIRNRTPEEEIGRAFTLFDRTGRGKILFDDLKRVCLEVGENLPDEELQAMIDEFDIDGDGFINKEEFAKICKDWQ